MHLVMILLGDSPVAAATLLVLLGLLALCMLVRIVTWLTRGSASAQSMLRRSCYGPRGNPGDHWPVHCKPCGGIQLSRGGACGGCGEAMLPEPCHAPVPARRGWDDIFWLLPRLAWYLWPITAAIGFMLFIGVQKALKVVSVSDFRGDWQGHLPFYQTYGFSWLEDVVGPSVAGGFILGLMAGYPVLAFMNSLSRSYGALRDLLPFGATRIYDWGVTLEKSWSEVKVLRGRRGLAVHVAAGFNGYAGAPVNLTVRFRGPDGHYLSSALGAYRGSHGELVRQYVTRPIQNEAARFTNLWVYIPTRALPLSQWAAPVDLVAEVLLSWRGQVLLEHDLPIHFEPEPEDLPVFVAPVRSDSPVATSPSGPIGEVDLSVSGVDLLGPVVPGEDVICQICGGELAENVVPCSACQTPHHGDCWEFMERCSTFGCEGQAGSAG